MYFLSNDEALAFNIRVWDEKSNQTIDPELVMNRLDRSRSAGGTPATTGGNATARADGRSPT
jgi:hypothetical protein